MCFHVFPKSIFDVWVLAVLSKAPRNKEAVQGRIPCRRNLRENDGSALDGLVRARSEVREQSAEYLTSQKI